MRGSRPPFNALEEEAEDLMDMISPSVCVCVFYASQRSSPLLCLLCLLCLNMYTSGGGRSICKEKEYAEKRNIPPSKARWRMLLSVLLFIVLRFK